jgi:adenosylcobinamide-GDP ribazoletransferase
MDKKQASMTRSLGLIRHLIAYLLQWVLRQYAELAAAVRFLSILPLPGPLQLFRPNEPKPYLVFGSGYFPFVGLLLGFLAGALALVLSPLVPHLILAALLLTILVLLTGGLHLDGLMDTCDGLFGGTTRERRLEIMHDSRIGSFGVLGGGCICLLKFATYASLNGHLLYQALVITLPLARWTMVLVLWLFPSARPTGLGATFRRSITWRQLSLAGATILAITIIAGQLIGLIIGAAVTLVAILVGAGMTWRLGGLTGDTYGAIAEATEVTALLLFALLPNRF